MYSQINSIRLPQLISENYFIIHKDEAKVENKDLLDNLTQFNVFIGPNNSGKSRFIRRLFGINSFNSVTNIKPMKEMDKKELEEFITSINQDISYFFKHYGFGVKEIYKIGFSFLTSEPFENEPIPKFRSIILAYINENLNRLNNIELILKDQKDLAKMKKEWNKLLNHYLKYSSGHDKLKIIHSSIVSDGTDDLPVTKIYIPALKGIRTFKDNSQIEEDIYKTRTFLDYFSGDNYGNEGWPCSDNIFTGLGLYKDITDHLLGDLKKRKLISDYQDFLSKYFFEGDEVALIPSVESKVLNIKIGDEKEQPIYNLGDGLQTMIIITYPLFRHTGDHILLFIEEPELYMHPGMQRMLLEALRDERFEKAQYFIATHSNHLLDMSIDIEDMSIFTFHKNIEKIAGELEHLPSFTIRNISRNDRRTLELIGVRNSSVFLSNCTIWVEGITDRLFLRHYLDLYMKVDEKRYKYKEDIHFSFVEYGGSNITHFSFLDNDEKEGINEESLCGKLFLVADRDEGKDARHKKLEEALKDRYYCLGCKEIENLIFPEVLQKVIWEYEDKEEVELFEYKDYKDQYLGEFIENKLAGKKTRKGSYKSDSGTVSDKVTFCRKAIKYTEKYDDLSEDAKKLIIQLYQFVEKNN